MRRLFGLALLAGLLAACGGDDAATYEINGRTWEIACDDLDKFADQYLRYDASEEVFNAWFEECGEDWVEPAFDRVLYGPDGEG